MHLASIIYAKVNVKRVETPSRVESVRRVLNIDLVRGINQSETINVGKRNISTTNRRKTMFYAIDKLDGSIVVLKAEEVKVEETESGYYLVKFFSGFDMDFTAKDKNGHSYANVGRRLVGSYFLDNIVGFREALTDEDLEELLTENMNEQEESLDDDSEGGEYVTM